MGPRSSCVRPRVCLAAFVLVSAWTLVPATQALSPRRVADVHGARCVLLADPRVHRSYVAPPWRRASLATTPGSSSNATIDVTYHGFTPEAQAAFQFAVDIWAAQLVSTQPITIDAEFADLGAGVLGSAGPGSLWVGVPGGQPDTFYPVAVTNRLIGYDADPGGADIYASFGSTFNWYYGTNGATPAGKYDFVSVVLHELGHGLGFTGSGRVPTGGDGRWGYTLGGVTYPTIYDRFVVNGSGESILNTALFPNPSAALTAQLTSDALYFSGPNERAANGNASARLYAPASWNPGSSYAHLNEATYTPGNPNSLMTPFLASAEAIHDPGPITRGMFQDMGWAVSTTPPACTYNSSVSPSMFPSSGGTGSVTVTTAAGCPWSVGTNDAWIAFASPTAGTGSATVNFSVASNPNHAARQGTITASGQALTIAQDGVPCTYAVAPTLITFGANGGSAPLSVTTNAPDCPITAVTQIGDWVAVSGNAVGTTTLTVSAGPSGASTRTSSIGIHGTQVAVRQNGHATPPFDIDHDGAGDLLAYDPSTGSHFFARGNPAAPGFSTGASSTWSTGWTVLPGDFNGDGRGDLFFYNASTGRAIKAVSIGTEVFAYFEFPWSAGWGVTVADLNGDGSDDVFVYNTATGRWYRCISQPDHSFSYTLSGTWSPNWSIYSGDFNGDGRADLFLYNASGDANHGRYYRVLSNPDETVTYLDGDVVWRTDWTITPGDYDGDGRTDLFLYRPSGEWYRVFFTAAGLRFENGAWSTGWTLSRGDFNADGRTDLFVYNETSGRWYVVISQADGSLAYYGDVIWSAGWKVHVTDVNVDGAADLVLYNPNDGRWFQAVTQAPGVFAFANGTWSTGLQIVATRPQSR
ncbi:MAG TPA: FG-GAP-like repeat-containing protein [Vicinamibacterales bacterium]|nr:FG-GAP-like repeat-containing protein [Vicinamibacterales bacterium]